MIQRLPYRVLNAASVERRQPDQQVPWDDQGKGKRVQGFDRVSVKGLFWNQPRAYFPYRF